MTDTPTPPTPSTPPTGGAEDFKPGIWGLNGETDENVEQFDKALAEAFGTATEPTTESDEDDDSGDGGEDADDVEGTGTSTPASAGSGEKGGESDPVPSGASDFASLFKQRYGVEPTQEDMEGYLALAEWAAGLTQDQQAAINTALTNPQAYTQPVVNQPPPTTPPTTDIDPILTELIEEYGEDHPLVKYAKLQQQNSQQVAQFNIQQQQAVNSQKIQSGSKLFQQKYELTDEELQSLSGAVLRAGTFPAFVQTFNDPEVAIQQAMDHAYWSNPAFRQREIQKEQDALKAKTQTDDTRKRKASSVTGTGGNGAPRTSTPPKTPEDRWAAVAAGIAEAQSNGQQS